MKDSVLLELASRWERDAIPPAIGPSAETREAIVAEVERRTKRECADALRMLVSLLGEDSQ